MAREALLKAQMGIGMGFRMGSRGALRLTWPVKHARYVADRRVQGVTLLQCRFHSSQEGIGGGAGRSDFWIHLLRRGPARGRSIATKTPGIGPHQPGPGSRSLSPNHTRSPVPHSCFFSSRRVRATARNSLRLTFISRLLAERSAFSSMNRVHASSGAEKSTEMKTPCLSK